jgi:hypothetical protein
MGSHPRQNCPASQEWVLNALMNGLTLLLTIFVAMSFGIYAGYALLMALLKLMGHRTEPKQTAPVLVTSQAHSGD